MDDSFCRYCSLSLTVSFILLCTCFGQFALAQNAGTLTQLRIEPDTSTVHQTVTGTDLVVGVTVRALDANGVLIDPGSLNLDVSARSNAFSPQNSYPLTFVGGIARATATISLIRQGRDGLVAFIVGRGAVTAFVRVNLVAVEILSGVILDSPFSVRQPMTGSSVQFVVMATAVGSKNSLLDSQGAELTVTSINNISVDQSIYSLLFINGVTTVTVTVNLLDQELFGLVLLDASPAAVLSLITVVEPAPRLNRLSVVAPLSVEQQMIGQPIAFGVTVFARDRQNNPVNPVGLTLMVSSARAAVPLQPTYTLNFIDGVAVTTVVSVLETEGSDGILALSVSNGDTTDRAFVTLRAFETLASLLLDVPTSVAEPGPDKTLEIAIVVTATGTHGGVFNPAGLVLTVIAVDNATLTETRFPLNFVNGRNVVTVSADLLSQGMNGSVSFRVATGTLVVTDSVDLRPFRESLESLSLTAPFSVTQQVSGEVLEIAIVVTATGTRGFAFDPAGLMLEVISEVNAVASPAAYPLLFSRGVSRITPMVNLLEQGFDGRVTLRVVSGSDEIATAGISLEAVEILNSLSVEVTSTVMQRMVRDQFDIPVTVRARGSKGSAFNLQNTVLLLTDIENIRLLQSSYALTFDNGIAQTTVTVQLSTEGIPGRLQFTVVSGTVTAEATVDLQAIEVLATVSISPGSLQVVQQLTDDSLDIYVTVRAEGSQGSPMNPDGVGVTASAGINAQLNQSSYPLQFVDGLAATTVSASLTVQGYIGYVVLGLVGDVLNDGDVFFFNVVVELMAVPLLRAFEIEAPATVMQQAPNATLTFSVVVSAISTERTPIDVPGFWLSVANIDNTVSAQNNYPLEFINGRAETTVFAALQDNLEAGVVRLTVISTDSSISIRRDVQLQPFPVQGLITLSLVSTPNFVGSRESSITLEVQASVNFIDPAEVGNITLQVSETPSVTDIEIMSEFNFLRDGVYYSTATATVQMIYGILPQFLFNQNEFPSTTLNLSISGHPDSVLVTAISVKIVLQPELLLVSFQSVPENVNQNSIGAPVQFILTPVFIADIDLLPVFYSGGEALTVRPISNVRVTQTSYPFTYNFASPNDFLPTYSDLLISLELINQEQDGEIELNIAGTLANDFGASVPSDNNGATLSLPLRVRLTALKRTLTIDAPDVVFQMTLDSAFELPLSVLAMLTNGDILNPADLQLRITTDENTGVEQNTYALAFVEGRADFVVNARLSNPGIDGELVIEVQSSADTALSTSATIALQTVELLSQLAVAAPATAIQAAAGSALNFVVTVSALNNYNRAFNPQQLQLQLQTGTNTSAARRSYDLVFVNGVAVATVTLQLQEQGLDGSVVLVVSSGTVVDSTEVSLFAVELLSSLIIETAAQVQQQQFGQQLPISVRIRALGTKGNPVSPQQLMLSATTGNINASLVQSHTLNFSDGIAELTVAAALVNNRRDGLVVLSVVDTVSGVGAAKNVLLAAFSELSAVNLSVDQKIYTVIGSRNDPIQIEVTAQLEFIGALRPVSLQLTADFSTPVASSSFDNPVVLNFLRNGIHYSTVTVTVSLVLGIDNYSPEILGGTLPTTGLRFNVAGLPQPAAVLTATAVAVVRPPINILTFSSVPAQVTQSGLNQPLRFEVVIGTVLDVDNLIVNINTGEALIAAGIDNVLPAQSTHTVSYVATRSNAVDRQLRVPIEVDLATQGMDGEIQLSVAGTFTNNALITGLGGTGSPPYNVRLIAAQEQLALLSVSAPTRVSQSTPGSVLSFFVTVTATGTFGRPFDPPLLNLMVFAAENAVLIQSSYVLTFVNGVAETIVTADLFTQGQDGRVELSVAGDGAAASATVSVHAVELLESLAIGVSDPVIQQAIGESLSIPVRVEALGTQGNAFDLADLKLQVVAGDNTTLTEVRYALNFVNGVAQATVTVGLIVQGINGSLELLVSSGTVVGRAMVSLQALELLSQLAIAAPATVVQTAAGNTLNFVVTVSALSNRNRAFDPEQLQLQTGTNTNVVQRSYDLVFENGVALTTVTLSLEEQGIDGRVVLSVASGSIEATATVLLRAVELLAVLGISVPVAVVQPAMDEALEIAVTVTATGTMGNAFDPADLKLEVMAGINTTLTDVGYALNFVDGAAQTTVTAKLVMQGEDGSVELSVVSGSIEDRVTVSLRAVELLAALDISAPVSVVQPAMDEALEIAVTITAIGTLGNVYDPADLKLQVVAADNTTLTDVSYALNFIDGVANATVIVRLLTQGENGTVRLTAMRGGVAAMTTVSLTAAPEVLARLTVNASAVVTQTVTGSELIVEVSVEAQSNYARTIDPGVLQLQLRVGANTTAAQSSYTLNFIDGVAQTTVLLSLVEQGINGSVLLSVAGNGIETAAPVLLQAIEILRALFIIAAEIAPPQISADLPVNFVVAVRALGSFNRPFDPGVLKLRLTAGNNTEVVQSSYDLTFSDEGRAEVEVQAGLLADGEDGSVMLSVMSGDIEVSAAVLLPNTPEALASLTIVAPDQLLQTALNPDLTFAVRVLARSNYLRPFEPQGLRLEVTAGSNTSLTSSSQPLNFVNGEAQIRVTASLLTQLRGGNVPLICPCTFAPSPVGSVRLSVTGAAVESSATVAFFAIDLAETLAGLSIDTADSIFQSAENAQLTIAVTVTATDIMGNAYDPQGVNLEVTAGDNTMLTVSSYALNFVDGVAQTTVTANLLTQGEDGSVLLSVTGGSSGDRATVVLGAVELLASLTIEAADRVLQERVGDDLTVAVRVLAAGTRNNAFEPQGISLEAVAGANTTLTEVSYALDFVDGVAQTTVTANLLTQGEDGSVLLSVTGGSSGDRATVVLGAVELLASLTIEAADRVLQERVGDDLTVAVRVLAAGTRNNAFEPQGISLEAVAGANTTLTEVSYALDFVNGVAQTTVTANLLTQGEDGGVLLSVTGGSSGDRARVVLRAVELLSSITFVVADQLAVQLPGVPVLLSVVVRTLGTQGGAVNPEGIYLETVAADNTTLSMGRRLLSFVNGQAQAQVSVELLNQMQSGLIELQLSGVPAGVMSQSVQVRILPASIASIELDPGDSELIQTAAGEVLQTTLTITVTGFYPGVFPLSRLELQYSSEPPLSSIEFSPQQLFFTTPTTGLASSLSVVVRIVPAQAQNTTLLLTVGNIPATIDLTAEVVPLRVTAVPRRLAFINLTATESTLRQLAAGQPVTATLTVIALDNYGQPFRLDTVALDITATNHVIVSTSQFRIIEDGRLELQLQVTPVDLLDTRVTLRVAEESLRGAATLLPTGGLSIFIQRPAAVLHRVVVELAGSDMALIQNDPRLPVQFEVNVRGLDQYGGAIGYPMLGLSISGSTTEVRIARHPEILTADANGSLVTVFVQLTQNTTLTVAVTDLPEGVAGSQLLLPIRADSGPLTPMIDLTGDTRVSETDIFIALSWLNSGRPTVLRDNMFVNLPITAAQITTTGFTSLQMLFTVQSAGENADVNGDSVADQLDLRLILRYLAGLRGPLLGNSDTVNRILLLLGRDQDINRTTTVIQ